MSGSRLRPLLRASLLPIPHRTARFSATAYRAIQHPSPTLSTGPRFVPRFLNPSLYLGLLKKRTLGENGKSKEWNPATFFIIIFILIGSQAIQLIALKHDHADKMRRADAKIGILREVIEKLQNGEEVDVERMLGTGNEKEEKSWEEVLKEIEDEDARWTARQRRNQEWKSAQSDERSGESDGNVAKASAAVADSKATPTAAMRQARSARDYFT